MRGTMLFGLLALAAAVAPAVAFASMDSPLDQWRSGVSLAEIQCSEGRILMETSSGKPACVSEAASYRMVERGWGIVERTQGAPDLEEETKGTVDAPDLQLGGSTVDIPDVEPAELSSATAAEPVTISERRITDILPDPGKKIDRPGHEPIPPHLSPTIIIDYPEQIRIGEAGTINLNYTFAQPGPVTGANPAYMGGGGLVDIVRSGGEPGQLHWPDKLRDPHVIYTVISHVGGMEILDDRYIDRIKRAAYTFTPQEFYTYEIRRMIVINSDPVWRTIEIPFRITEPLSEIEPYLKISINDSVDWKYIQTKDGVATFLDENPYEIPDGTIPFYRFSNHLDFDSPESIPHGGQFGAYVMEYVKPNVANVTELIYNNTDYPLYFYKNLFELYPELNMQKPGAIKEVEEAKTDPEPIKEYLIPTRAVSTDDFVFINMREDQYERCYVYWPLYTITYPATARVGVPFDVTYDYTYVIPDLDTGSYEHPECQCTSERCKNQAFTILASSYIDILNEGIGPHPHVTRYDDGSRYTVDMPKESYYMDVPFGNTEPLQMVFKVVINEPEEYRIGVIYPTIHSYNSNERMYFYVDDDGTVYFDPTLATYDGAPGITEKSRLANTPIAAEAEAERSTRKLIPDEIISVPAPSSLGPRDGPLPAYYQSFADKMLAEHPGVHYEQWFLDNNFTRSWVDDFLEAMPHLYYDQPPSDDPFIPGRSD